MKRMIFAMAVVLSPCACKSVSYGNQDNSATIVIDSISTPDSATSTDTHPIEANNSAELLKNRLSPKVNKMLLVSENTIHYRFNDNSNLKSKDPHTFWLMNRMMQMFATIESADDDLAWVLAVDKCICDYNSRHGKKQLSTIEALHAIEKFIEVL